MMNAKEQIEKNTTEYDEARLEETRGEVTH